MFDALLFGAAVFSAGVALLRALGLAKGVLTIGLAPGAGLAVLAIVSTWLTLLGAPPPVAGIALAGIALGGLAVMLRERAAIEEAAQALWREHALAPAVLVAALVVPSLVMAFAFAGVEVPLSPHDGAAHTEAVQAYRSAQAQFDWYPPGLTSVFAAWLELAPWLDSAKGAFELGVSLPLLAALAVFGLSVAIWGDLRAAAVSALLLGFTYVYPYFPELWSGWPLAASLVLAVTLWAVAYQYLERPSWRLGVLSGLLLGAILLIHGTELYTLAIVLPIVLVACWRGVHWLGLGRDLALALGVAVLAAAIYLPTLLHWQAGAGAYAVGLEDASVPAGAGSSVSAVTGPDPFLVFGLGALGVDLPLRVAVLAIGVGWAFWQRRGRAVVLVGLVFTAVTTVFTWFAGGVDLVRQVYALTFPWGMHYRIFMVVAVCQVLLAGVGAVSSLRWLMAHVRLRIVRRLVGVLVVAWLGVMCVAMTALMVYPTQLVLGYGPDDAVAMAWLRTHASPGDVVVNDGYADAGIWAPYKTGLPVLLPRWGPEASDPRRLLVWQNITRLNQVPEAMAAACAVNARYVYRGARQSEWDARSFPSVQEMRIAGDLETVFASANSVVFRIRLRCTAS